MAKLVGTPQGIKFYSDYDPKLVDALKKQIPYQDRTWDNGNKCWIVALSHEQTLIDLSIQWLGITPTLQGSFNSAPQKETKLLRIEYIGGLRDRGDGSLSSLGATANDKRGWLPMDNDLQWVTLFPESVLREFFEGGNAKSSVVMTTYYSVLAIKQAASQNEIKAAWREMAKRYHPDINRDPDAPETMQAINRAYEVLRNPNTRKRYDAGLALQQGVANVPDYFTVANWQKSGGLYWRPPLRCGWIMCEGYQSAGKFIVETILEWKDIVENGKTLVTSWPAGSDSLVRSWI